MANPGKKGTPRRKTSKINNHDASRRSDVRVAVGEPWDVEIARIREKKHDRVVTIIVVALVTLLTTSMAHAWVTANEKQSQLITQFVFQGLSTAIGWAFGKASSEHIRK